MLSNNVYPEAANLVARLVDCGLLSNLAHYGEHCTEVWFQKSELEREGFWAASGATKVCFGHVDFPNWVIKVGYTEKVKFDYARKENEIYTKAVAAGLEYYFPETKLLGIYGGRPFFIQQCAECVEHAISSEWYERLRSRYEEDEEEYDPNELWDEIDYLDDWERAMLLFGNEDLCNFLSDNGVNDLHEGNFGYVGDHIVIVDFSGFAG